MLGGEHNGNEEEEAVDGLVTNVVGPFDVRGAPFETETDEHNHADEAADGRYEVGGIAGEREMGEHCVVGFVRESERVSNK